MTDTFQVSIDNEVFSLRDNESMRLWEEQPADGRFIAVMARSVEMPEGLRSQVRHADGAPVEQAAIVGCEWGAKNDCWHWLQISPPSKERIGDLMFDGGCEKDRWYFLTVTDLNAERSAFHAGFQAGLKEARPAEQVSQPADELIGK